jgi:BirA family biotin operon repressor/biotin-[acetyl-CoA-carboxylase] ligase
MQTGILDIDHIRASLRTERIGRRIEHVESTCSTNDEAWERINEAGADGLVVLAEHQSAGRGRLGRTWQSPRGASLLSSTAVIDASNELNGGELSLLAAVALRDAVVRSTDVVPTIKWPNDLLAAGKKLGGILIESRLLQTGERAYVAGIGINCLQHEGHFPPELTGAATSLDLQSRHHVDRSSLAIALIEQLDSWLAHPGGWMHAGLRDAWLARAEPLGHRIVLQHGGKAYSGSVLDIDPSAALVVQLDEGGIRAFNAADTVVSQRSVAKDD